MTPSLEKGLVPKTGPSASAGGGRTLFERSGHGSPGSSPTGPSGSLPETAPTSSRRS